MNKIHSQFFKAILVLSFISYSNIYSQQDAENVAKALSNPVASMYSVPFQNNFQLGIGPEKGL